LGPIATVVETATMSGEVVIRMRCPRGSRPLSGGGAGPGGDGAAIQLSVPTPDGWQVGLHSANSAPVPVTGYVVCLAKRPGKPVNR
jgi:hypothetical protein